ncbi:MAG: DUF3619 family protein [Pseudomonadota bacterium]
MTVERNEHLDEQFAHRLAKQLDEAHDVPDEVAERLFSARQQALAQVTKNETGRFGSNRVLWPGLGVGATAAAALVVVLTMPPQIEPLPLGTDVELAVSQDLELLEELEFVAWMVAMEDPGATDHSG